MVGQVRVGERLLIPLPSSATGMSQATRLDCLIHKTETMKAVLSYLQKHLSDKNIYCGSFLYASS